MARSTVSKGWLLRLDRAWQKKANRDLPAPVGPPINIVSSCIAKIRSISVIACIDAPMTGRSTSGSVTVACVMGSPPRYGAAIAPSFSSSSAHALHTNDVARAAGHVASIAIMPSIR